MKRRRHGSAKHTVLYAPESFARAFARTHKRRVKRHATLAVDGTVAPLLSVSVRDSATPFTKRILCAVSEVEAELDGSLPPGMACAIGKPVWHAAHESNLRVGRGAKLPVFVTPQNSERVPELLASSAFSSALDAMALVPGESLQTLHAFSFTLAAPTIERLEAAFQAAEQLLGAFPRDQQRKLPRQFPQALLPLSPVLLEWGIADPSLRATRVAEAHPDALKRLLSTAAHYAGKVQAYLQRTRYPDRAAAQTLRAYVHSTELAKARLDGVTPLRRRRE